MNRLIEKWKNAPVTLKSSIAIFISSLFLRGISFLTTPIFTRILSSAQYGLIALYNSWLSIIEVIAVLGLMSAGSFNVGLNDNKKQPYRYMSNCLGLCNLTTVILFFFILIFKKYDLFNIELSNNMLLLMFIHLLFYPAQIFLVFYQKFEYKYKLSTILVIISTIVGQGLAIVGVVNCKTENGAFTRLLMTEIATLMISIPIYFAIIGKGKEYLKIKKWPDLLKFILPLIPHYLAQHIMTSADKIMISKYSGNTEAGIYSIVLNISLILDVFWNAVNASLVPYTFKNLENGEHKKIEKISTIAAIGSAIVCVLIMLIAPEIIKILAPEEYYIGIYVVPALVVVSFTKVLYNIFANVEFFYKKSKRILSATIVASCSNLILNRILIPKYGFFAAGYTTLASYIILIIMHYLGYKSCVEKNKVYNEKIMFVTLFFLMIISVIVNILYLNVYIRFGVILLIIAGLWWKKDFLKSKFYELLNKKNVKGNE